MTPPRFFFAGSQSPPQSMRTRHFSSPAERLVALERRKIEIQSDFARLNAALADGRIRLDEYRYYIARVHDGKTEAQRYRELHEEEGAIRDGIAKAKKHPTHLPAIALLLLVIIGSFAGLLLFDDNYALTGFTMFTPRPTVEVVGLVDGGLILHVFDEELVKRIPVEGTYRLDTFKNESAKQPTGGS